MQLPASEEISIAFRNMTDEETMRAELPRLLDIIRGNSIFQSWLNNTLFRMVPEVTMAPEVREYLDGVFRGAMLFGLGMGLHIGAVQQAGKTKEPVH